MTDHKWLRPRNWNDGTPMNKPMRPEPAKCENCGVVVYDAARFDLSSRPCPETVQHTWILRQDGDGGWECPCGSWTSTMKVLDTPCSIEFKAKPNMHTGREVMVVPTVIVDARTVPNTSIERQALLDIVELIDNQYDDLYVLRMVDQIAKKVLNE
jgi:hypothetical protein